MHIQSVRTTDYCYYGLYCYLYLHSQHITRYTTYFARVDHDDTCVRARVYSKRQEGRYEFFIEGLRIVSNEYLPHMYGLDAMRETET